MKIPHTILGLLLAGPQTGYDLKRAFDSSLGFFAGASFGSIYPVLRRLAREGLVRMKTEIQDGRPNRKVYRLTPKGRRVFLQAAADELVLSPYRNEFLTRLFFFSELPAARRRGILEEYRAYLEDRLRTVRGLQPEVRERADAYQWLCYRFGLRYLADLRRNLRRLAAELERVEKGEEA